MAIARYPSFVIDCPDPGALAAFYGTMLDWKVEVTSDWAEIRAENGHCISFQPVPAQAYTPPKWPGQEVPQQMPGSRGLRGYSPNTYPAPAQHQELRRRARCLNT